MRTINEIITDLYNKFPQYEATLPKGGAELTYIAWYHVVHILDQYAPGWSGRIDQVHSVGPRIVLTYRIDIPCEEGVVSRTATGTEEMDMRGYGDPSSNAESMAFRRAAAKFGVGLYLYDKSAPKHVIHTSPMEKELHPDLVASIERAALKDMRMYAKSGVFSDSHQDPSYEEIPSAVEEEDGKRCKGCNKYLPPDGKYDVCWNCKQKNLVLCKECGVKKHDAKYPACFECNKK